MNNFVQVHSEFEETFRTKSDWRWVTMKTALNLALQGLHGAPVSVLETGCQRLPDDWGGGCSTWLIAKALNQYAPYGSTFVSIDIDPANCKLAADVLYQQGLLEVSAFRFKQICADSLTTMTQLIDAPVAVDTRFEYVYLDSLDAFPWEGGEELTIESQKHQLAETHLALQLFSDKNPFKILLLDDNDLMWGGKCKLTKEFLSDMYWTCVWDSQQSLWIQRNEKFQVW